MTDRKQLFGNSNRSSLAGLVFCVLGFATPALAAGSDDLHPLLSSGFSLDVGIFYPDRDLDLRVNGTVGGDNREFDFDGTVGRDSNDNIFAAELAWRFRSNWAVLAQFFDSSNSSRTTLEEDIEWGDVVFAEGSGVTAGTSITVTRLFVGRHLDTDPHHDIGLGVGVHWLDIDVFIDGTIVANGNPVAAKRTVSSDGPVPNLGMWYRYSMSPRWAFRTRLDLLSASIGEYSGLLLNASAGFNFQTSEHFGIGVSYNLFVIDLEIDKPSWRGNVESVFNGPYVSISAYY